MARVHAFTDDALGTRDAVGVVEAIRAGEVSVADLVEAAVARIERVDGVLGGMAYRLFDAARVEARQPHQGFFAGVPTVIKDNVDVAGAPTRNGTDAYLARPARHDGEVVKTLRRLGLIPVGKTQLSEYGFSGTAEHPRLGAVRSPWDLGRVAGASSAGAGALVAAGAVPLAHGNDGGGSIRIPASVNGLVGLKPTRGRVPQDPIYGLAPVRIVSDGVLTRSVRDTAAFLREVERVRRLGNVPAVGDVRGPSRRRLRIGMATELGERTASAEVAALTENTAELLADLGHRVEPVAPAVPASLADDFVLYWSTLALALVSSGRSHGRSWHPDRLDNLTRGLAGHARRHFHRAPAAVRRLRAAAALATDFHETYDVMLTPTLAHETPQLGYLDPTQPFEVVLERLMDWVAFTPWHNVTGGPAVSLPLQTTVTGLPQGMMFAAAPGREAVLLGLAFELEQARPWPRLGST